MKAIEARLKKLEASARGKQRIVIVCPPEHHAADGVHWFHSKEAAHTKYPGEELLIIQIVYQEQKKVKNEATT